MSADLAVDPWGPGADRADRSTVRVRFDADDPAKTITLGVAEQMLMAWRARNPAQFGYRLAEALTGVEPSKTGRVRA